MLDRDPVLDKALDEWYRATSKSPLGRVATFEVGWHAAFRSLGAGTPEAVAALRELVTAIRTPVATMSDIRLRDKAVRERMDVFFCIATPPEEADDAAR